MENVKRHLKSSFFLEPKDRDLADKKIKLGIPKGSLQDRTLSVFRDAGFEIDIPKRSYILNINDQEIDCYLLRPQEIPVYVQQGKLDLGICGEDWVSESRSSVVKICDLKYAKQEIKKVKWVLAVRNDSKIKRVKDLEGKIISTEAVNLTKDYLKKNKIKAKVKFSWGATEVKPPIFADAIVDITETGASLRAHNLRVIDVVFVSSTKLVASKKALKDRWKKNKIKEMSLLLNGAVRGAENVITIAEVSSKNLDKVFKIIPKIKKPAVRKIIGEDLYEIKISCHAKENRELIPKLKKIGCREIIEYPMTKLIL